MTIDGDSFGNITVAYSALYPELSTTIDNLPVNIIGEIIILPIFLAFSVYIWKIYRRRTREIDDLVPRDFPDNDTGITSNHDNRV